MDLTAARQRVQNDLSKGVKCPCCDQWAKLYRRHITSSMAHALILMYRYFAANPNDDDLHVARFLVLRKRSSDVAGGDVIKLRHWGLIERGKRVGHYRLTVRGRQFVRGRSTVPKFIYLFNNTVMNTSPDTIVIQDIFAGTKLNYNELMR